MKIPLPLLSCEECRDFCTIRRRTIARPAWMALIETMKSALPWSAFAEVRSAARITALGLLLGWSTLSASPPTVEELFREPTVRSAALSPDGNRIVLLYRTAEKKPDMLCVVDTARLNEPKSFRRFSLDDADTLHAQWVTWATDDRLLIGIDLGSEEHHTFSGGRIEAIDADGSHPVVLFGNSKRLLKHNFNLARIVGRVPGDPTHLIIPAWGEWTYDLFRVDVMTGEATPIAEGRSNTVGWQAKDGQAVLRYDITSNGRVVSTYGRAAPGADWSLLARYLFAEFEQADWIYAGPAPGQGQIYVRTRRPESDTFDLYTFDLATKSYLNVAGRAPGFDIHKMVAIDGAFAGVSYFDDTLKYVLTDAGLQKHVDSISRYFKERANIGLIDIDRTKTRMLIRVSGPQDPGDYYVYDVRKARLDLLMSARPWLAPEQLAAVEPRHIRTRDGALVTVYVTHPVGRSGALPLVVMPHGGPEVRDSIDFDPEAQAFAAQGWVVLQPNFRGSGGYGRAFAEAGHHQWSRRMQDDITDAVEDLVHAGIARPDRIVIYGASYGGYAALAGAFVTPNLYRAVVSRAGPTDLTAMLRYEHEETDDDGVIYHLWADRIGDLRSDAAAIRAASPSEHAGEFSVPVLLIHGEDDPIVPFQQSRTMQSALQHAGKSVRLEMFREEGHSGWKNADEVKQMNDSIAFFKSALD
jgi:dipeptidyl aminopeptidase/acylaminoacyl peptidase